MKAKILIVEDEPLVRMFAVDLAQDAGFETLEAEDADSALKILVAVIDICIVMTDIDMPGSMNGLKLAEVVHDRWPNVSIVVVSGKQRPDEADLPRDAVFFSKPYSATRLADQLIKMAPA
ncbi:two-component system response regulator [Rhizobium sp. Root708]|uniref:response regulator n=1 Tax=Rhizobium sp. Root708 TaxID=1736592 RepID=UPI00070053D8|nr:response regulator [Rhizobium sp. Root708]KRB49228.1 two-component system response regulator [Rhizobium sp. Root708]